MSIEIQTAHFYILNGLRLIGAQGALSVLCNESLTPQIPPQESIFDICNVFISPDADFWYENGSKMELVLIWSDKRLRAEDREEDLTSIATKIADKPPVTKYDMTSSLFTGPICIICSWACRPVEG